MNPRSIAFFKLVALLMVVVALILLFPHALGSWKWPRANCFIFGG